MSEASALGRAYHRVYEGLCGHHPSVRPWHFQWLDTFYLYRDLRRWLGRLEGRVLDAGCGDKPYRAWFGGGVTSYVGLDVVPGPAVDIVVAPDERWPVPDSDVDVLLSSQVLEHVANLPHTLAEMRRVVRPGGTLVLSFPFIYNEHGAPFDYQRFTAHRAVRLFEGFEVLEVRRQGGIGSTLAILALNWLEESSNRRRVLRFAKALLMPLWVVVCLGMNMAGWLVDRLDRSGAYYSNILVVFRKPDQSSVERLNSSQPPIQKVIAKPQRDPGNAR